MEFVNLNGQVNNKITFSSSYYCWNFLPKQIIMKKLDKPKFTQPQHKSVTDKIDNPLTRAFG